MNSPFAFNRHEKKARDGGSPFASSKKKKKDGDKSKSSFTYTEKPDYQAPRKPQKGLFPKKVWHSQ